MDMDRVFSGTPITPEAILNCRTARASRQRELLRTGCPCLVSYSLNIPGAVKQFPLARQAFQEGLTALRQRLTPYILKEEVTDADTGCEALFCIGLPPEQVKKQAAALEEYHPLGRLFDIDVLDPSGNAVSRTHLGLEPRKCLLCGQNAKLCARSQAHSMDAIRLHIAQTLDRYFRDQAADACAAKATRALLYEVSATPKPGLVDRANSGSHRDMDFFTFLDSSAVLSPWSREMFCIGWDNCGAPSDKLFQRLRFTGQQAEAAMLTATNGVNTHKGLIFSLGLLCGALGVLQTQEPNPIPMERVLALYGELGTFALEDFKGTAVTNGVRCYLTHNVFGFRGEAARGFPTAAHVGLPALKKWTAAGLSLNDAAAVTLLTLVAHTEDTNMIHRGVLDLARQRQKQAADLLDRLSLDNYRSVLNSLDQQYRKENLSPGGCADLLAISLMLFFTLPER